MAQEMQIGTVVGGDLKKQTIKIEIDENFHLKGGTVAIIDIHKISIRQLTKLKEFINTL